MHAHYQNITLDASHTFFLFRKMIEEKSPAPPLKPTCLAFIAAVEVLPPVCHALTVSPQHQPNLLPPVALGGLQGRQLRVLLISPGALGGGGGGGGGEGGGGGGGGVVVC